MAPSTSTPTNLPSEPQHGDLLKVSAYDRAASMLVALLVMIGLFVAVLVVIWITNEVFTRPPAPELYRVEEEGISADDSSGLDIDEPGLDQLDLEEPDVQDTLAAVTDAVSTVVASLDAVDSAVSSRGRGGDNRKRGAGGPIPRWQRWEIRYSTTTLESYLKQLDHFGIELGAVGGGQATIDYVRYQGGKAVRRAAPQEAKDRRLYFIWQSGRFKEQDRALLTQAGVATTGRILCQFYPPAIENQLAVLEQQQLGTRELKQVKKTVFGVKPVRRGFEFYVLEIRWR